MARCCVRRQNTSRKAGTRLSGSAQRPAPPIYGRRLAATQTSGSQSLISSHDVRRARNARDRRNLAELKVRINSYLFHELEVDGEDRQVSGNWPFRLREVQNLAVAGADARVFTFSDGHNLYFVQAGRSLSFWIDDGMSAEDLRLHMLGEKWIIERGAIDLSSVRQGQGGIPSKFERRKAIRDLALLMIGDASRVLVLEGLFFPFERRYLALVEDLGTGCAYALGSDIEPHRVKDSDAAPWRRLYIATGEMLQSGELRA